MSQREYQDIEFELSHGGRVGWITLDRPEEMNALSRRLLDELDDALDRLASREDAKPLVVTGNGDAFSAGYDLSPSDDGGEETAYEAFRREETNYDRMKRIWGFSLPTIGAINGYALAGGFELSQMLDIAAASTETEFGYPIVRGTGTPPVFFLPFVVDNRTARELLFTGRLLSGSAAEDAGLVNRTVEPDELDTEIERLIDDIPKAPSDLLYLNKRMMNRALEIMGYSSVVEQGHDLHVTGHEAPSVKKFWRRVSEDGLGDALRWRDETVKE